MRALKIRVQGGRIKLDEPTSLPNGTELYVVSAAQLDDVVLIADEGMDDEEREALLEALDESLDQAANGELEDFSKFIADARRRA